jgi:hypothetical protein
MANPDITSRIDALRHDIAALLDDKSTGLTPRQKAALKEIGQLLAEAADEAEEAGL